MPENPLLPNKRLKELLELMQRSRALDRRLRPAPKHPREALLAGTAIHLVPGDILNSSAADATALALAPAPLVNPQAANAIIVPDKDAPLPRLSRLTLAAAMAHGLQVSGTGGIVLTLVNAGTAEPGWQDALIYAQRARLPLLIAVADATNGRPAKSPHVLTLTAVQQAAKKIKLPVLPVDGDDAVGVYRVMQECALRARLSEGPAVIWGVHTSANKPPARATQPIARMQRYLAARGLL